MPYHVLRRHQRTCSWLPLRGSWHRVRKRPVPERGVNKQCGGQPYSRPPQRDPIFRDAKFFCFGAINNRRNDWLGIPFCCHIGWVFTRACKRSLGICRPLISAAVWCSAAVISKFNQAAVGTRVTVTAMKLAEPLYQSITSRGLLATLTETV